MRGTTAIIAALPGELKPLVSPSKGLRWQRLQAGKGTVLWERRHAHGRWIAGCSGMGGNSAPLSIEEGGKNIVRLVTDVPASLTNHYLEAKGEIPW